MYDHVSLAVADLAASTRFYTALLGREPGHVAEDYVEWEDLDLFRTGADRPVTTGLHVALAMPSTDAVDAAWRRGREVGAPDDGAPGPRSAYGPTYYGGFLRDPDGNSAEAVWRQELRRGGDIDHLWVRVRDPEASAAFYDAIAPLAGLRRVEHVPGACVHYAMADGGLLRLLAGAPTTPFHLAFAASDRATVDAFWARATEAGHRDNGGPGERPEYHPGYYGAFVLDPDGHNVESVFHDR